MPGGLQATTHKWLSSMMSGWSDAAMRGEPQRRGGPAQERLNAARTSAMVARLGDGTELVGRQNSLIQRTDVGKRRSEKIR
eukprot:scaffold110694_cov66-Phaeocystis_antarctica.AAC.4